MDDEQEIRVVRIVDHALFPNEFWVAEFSRHIHGVSYGRKPPYRSFSKSMYPDRLAAFTAAQELLARGRRTRD